MSSYFKGLGSPPEKKLQTLPMWAREWIETLKYRVLYWRARLDGTQPPVSRVNVSEPPAEKLFGLPVWAQDWIDTLNAESIDLKDRVQSQSRRSGQLF